MKKTIDSIVIFEKIEETEFGKNFGLTGAYVIFVQVSVNETHVVNGGVLAEHVQALRAKLNLPF